MAALHLILLLGLCFSVAQVRCQDHDNNFEYDYYQRSGKPSPLAGLRRKLTDGPSLGLVYPSSSASALDVEENTDQPKLNENISEDPFLSEENKMMLRMLVSVLRAKNQFSKGYEKGTKGISEVVDSLASLVKDVANIFYNYDDSDSNELADSSIA